MAVSQELLNWGAGVLTTISGGYALYMNRKSKKAIQNEEESVFIDNAAKLADVWEKLSKTLQDDIRTLKEENKEIFEKYTQLKVDFETQKNTSAFIIKKLELDLEKLTMENSNLKKENSELRELMGGGSIRKLS